jgi:pentatricopeptide repeat protein
VQLFDWARSLPAEHPQAATLCTPGTYAAMIELHGQWRQPGKALRLLGDAKGRGLEAGSEIYSALVQALCRWVGKAGCGPGRSLCVCCGAGSLLGSGIVWRKGKQ